MTDACREPAPSCAPAPCREPLRADAERNRQALVRAAREVFGQKGLNAPLDEIARRACVGNATLYRRFPTRNDLVAAVFAERLAHHVEAVRAALAEPNPWTGFRGYLVAVCRMQAADRGLADLLTMSTSAPDEVEELRASAYDGFTELVRRAKAVGALRADFEPEDFVILLMAGAGLLERTGDSIPTGWERLVSFVLDGLRASAASPAPPSPGEQAVVAVMTGRGAALGCPPSARPS